MRRPHAAAFLLLLAACVPRHRAPVAGARLSVEADALHDDGPFRVAFAGPRGEDASTREVTIAFSRPVVAAGLLEGGLAPAAVIREHDGKTVEGAWRWFGGRTAIFWPKDPFADATSYRVTMDRAIRALDGSTLAAFEPFGFSTTRPALVRAGYAYDEDEGRHVVTLDFNQTMSPAAVKASIRIEGKRGGRVEQVSFSVLSGEDAEQLELRADPAIASLEGVTVVAAPSLTSDEGPLPSGRERRVDLPEIGPLRAHIDCLRRGQDESDPPPKDDATTPRCELDRGSVELRFSKGVDTKDLIRNLVLSAPRKRDDDLSRSEWKHTERVDLSSSMDLAPGRKYRVTVKRGVRAVDKEKLSRDLIVDFETLDYASTIAWRDIGRTAVVERARGIVPLHLWTMNVPSFEAIRAPLDEAQVFDLLLRPKASASRVRAMPGSTSERVAVAGRRNDGARARFDLASEMRAKSPASAFAVATSAEGVDDDVRLLSVTDLGISSKWSPHGGLVWVTRLSTGAPVARAKVSLRRAFRPTSAEAAVMSSEAYPAITDDDGIARIPAQAAAAFLEPDRSGAEAILVVTEGDDRAYAHLPHLDADLARAVGTIFTDRRLYRPGESVMVKGYFRAPTGGGLVTLAGRQASIEAVDDEDRVFAAQTVTLDAFGAFATEIPIPRTARLGFALVHARVGAPLAGELRRPHRRWDPGTAYARFTVDELRAVELQVETATNHAVYTHGDTAQLTVRGKYLFGAPMRDVPAEIRVTRAPTRFTPPGFERFATDDYVLRPSRASSLSPVALLDARVGADGAITVPVSLALPQQSGPEHVTFEASIEDVSRAFAAADETSSLVHPGDLYLGVRLAEDASPVAGRPMQVEILAGGVDGARRSGVDVHVDLLEADKDGEPVRIARCDRRSTEAIASCTFTPPRAALYWVRASAVDTKGRPATAAVSFHAYVPSIEPRPAPVLSKPAPAPVAVEPPLTFEEACARSKTRDYEALTVERDVVAVGDVARVCMRGDPRTLVTLEREGVLRHEIRKLGDAGTIVSIPITPELHPNFIVALHGVRGRTAPFVTARPGDRAREISDYGRPTSWRTSAMIRVTAPEKKLQIAIATPDEARPGAEIEARVRVTDGLGRPTSAQVTLWAVDEGVFLLEPFSAPDPLALFSDERGRDVIDGDTRDELLWEKVGAHRVKSPSLRQGATSVGPRDHIGRSVFRPTAWFLPNVVTRPDGTAVVKAKLPDNLTTWRVFAVAATTADAFGSAETSFRTNKPLMVRPQLPRFMRVGDHVEATAVVDSLSKQPLQVKVLMSASGALAGNGGMLVTIPPEGHVPVRFDVDARAAGKGAIVFSAAAQSAKLLDEVTVEQDVAIPATLETVVVSGETRARADEPLGDLSRARRDAGGFDFRLSTSPLVGLAESLGGLLEYPYGCTEQLTSRLVPLVRARALSRELGVALPRDVDGAVRSALSSLLSHQRGDGGFGFWPQSRASEPWLTIIAVGALHAARQSGYTVPETSIARALGYLEDAKLAALDAGDRALMEDLFADMNRPRERELRALAANPDALPLFGRALVAHALAKVDRALGKRLLDGVASRLRLTGATATLGDESDVVSRRHLSSDARTTAMALRAFVALEPESPLVAKLVRGLLSMRKDGRWPTTQASAWALVALDAARSTQPQRPGASTARLSLDGADLAQVSFKGGLESIHGSVAMARLQNERAIGGALSFVTDRGTLFYEGALRYARRELPSAPLEHGIHVAKTMRVLQRRGEPVAASRFRAGDYVEVDLVLASPVPRDLVVVDDPLPSGFEAVNQSYANANRQAFRPDASGEVTHRELRDDRVVSFFDRLPAGVHHTSYVLRVISPGRFVTPPTKAECMYAPDVFGRTAASTIEARP
ncbi:MAG: hypothetical protein KF819_12125 [Labilithrix sp.]|nr:hypothetical protein [Labilithrix sp.]